MKFLVVNPPSIYQYEIHLNCLHHTPTVSQPFLLLVAANLALTGFLGKKWRLLPVPTCLAVQRSKAVFLLTLHVSINDIKYFQTISITHQLCHINFCCWWLKIWASLIFGLKMELMSCADFGWRYNGEKLSVFMRLYDNINDVKLFQTVSITSHPCRSHFCCWLLPIWPKLDFWAENGAYVLCRLGWQYNGAKMYFSRSYIIVSMIWNSSELSASHLSRVTVIFVVDCCQFGPR